ncbi:MAG TPA: Fe-S cluster assembly protein HesB [Blastocatellia bacterium]|nr:Fe-S cluster assembly protein HesB [Blastocatellia bacterium]
MELIIPTPPGFSFRRTVASHGWCELQPFECDLKNWTLTRVLDLNGGQAVTVTLSETAQGVKIVTKSKLGKRAAEKVAGIVRHMLRLDDEMSVFYGMVAADPDFAWVAKQGAGRLLRSPTVFEDLVKMICTTNCSWALTRKMNSGLINALGGQSADGRRSFPTPAAMAGESEKFYRDEVRAGYRAPYLKELAERVASGELDVESWLHSDKPTAELKREMKRVKGVGDYAAENVLKLVGRYDGLALDSWVRGKFSKLHNGSRAANDKKIERYYKRFGEWRGLALWCDMTQDWLDEQGQPRWEV